nr:hypothetical protein [Saccharopolyspora sp. HNM0983]
MLAPTSLEVRSGELLVVAGDPHDGHTALALVLSGRMRPGEGTVHLDDDRSPAALRRAVSVVDAPGVTEPDGAVPLHDVIAEGLSLAGRRSGRRSVRTWLHERGIADRAKDRFEHLPHPERTRVLVDLARLPRTTGALVLDSPDRHGTDPTAWHPAAAEQAQRGLAVIVLCAPHSAERLDIPVARIGADNIPRSTPDSPEGAA